MASTMKLQDAAKDSVNSLFNSLTTNTAKESTPGAKNSTPVHKAEEMQSGRAHAAKDDIKTVTTPKHTAADTEALDMTKVGVCFNVPKHIKDMWKTYFTSHGLTMTDGLIQAVQYLKEQEEKGEVKLGAISVLRK